MFNLINKWFKVEKVFKTILWSSLNYNNYNNNKYNLNTFYKTNWIKKFKQVNQHNNNKNKICRTYWLNKKEFNSMKDCLNLQIIIKT